MLAENDTVSIDKVEVLTALGNMDIPTGLDRMRYLKLIYLIFESDGYNLTMDADTYAYYESIFPASQASG